MRAAVAAVFGLAALAAAVAAVQRATDELRARVDAWRSAHEAQIVGELDALTRLRSVAADPHGLHAAADFLLRALQQRGFDARLLSTEGVAAPLVFGSLAVAGARRTVTFYAHYDGQPVTASQWSSDPFVPVMRAAAAQTPGREIDWRSVHGPFDPEWRLFGRAVADDKASIEAFLAAFDALKASNRSPSVNLAVAWEGEEEEGSPHLEALLRENQALLKSDLWLIGDGPVHQSGRPMIDFGARGVVGLTMTVYGPMKPLHDGHYGNWAPNPAAMAASLLGQMRAADGRILIPGFADEVRSLTPLEQRSIQALPSIDAALEREFGIGRPESDEDLALSLMRSALNVRGIRSGQVGAAAANAIPTAAEVSIDFRLVPDQTPQGVRRALERFLEAAGWTVVASEPDLATRRSHARIVRLEWEPGYPALRTDMATPVARAVIAAASRAAREPLVLLPMTGGSTPLYLFAQVLHVPVVGLPIVNHDDNQHAANENLRLLNLWDGIRTYAALMTGLDW